MKVIVFAGGGTLGHIYPMIPVIDRLKGLYPEIFIIFIGSKTGLENKVLKDNPNIDEFYYLDIQGFKRKLSFKNFTTISKYFKSIKFCHKLFTKKTPDVVVGVGAYVSGPSVKSASKLKIKTIIHEQNSVLGLANRLLIKKVDLILLSYDIIIKGKKSFLIGNPRSSQVYEQTQKLIKTENSIPMVLVVGGSRGASQINETILKLSFEFKARKIKVILITGERYYHHNIEKIKLLENQYLEVISFSNDLIRLMSQADLVISRSGATTIAELMALNKITLFIPSPNVTNNHQYKNAQVLAKNCAAKILTEEKLTPYTLIYEIEELLFNTKLRLQMSKNIKKFQYLDATDKFVGAIINL